MDSTPVFSTGDALAAVEWYAEGLALVHHFRLEQATDIAARLRVTPAEWVAIDLAWTEALTHTRVALDPAVIRAFVAVFARARLRLLEDDSSPLREMPMYLRRPPEARAEPKPEAPGSSAELGSTDGAYPGDSVRAPPGPPCDTLASAGPALRSALPFVRATEDGGSLAAHASVPPEPPYTENAPPPTTAGHETELLSAYVPGPALPFAPPSEPGEDDPDATAMLPRFDPRTE